MNYVRDGESFLNQVSNFSNKIFENRTHAQRRLYVLKIKKK